MNKFIFIDSQAINIGLCPNTNFQTSSSLNLKVDCPYNVILLATAAAFEIWFLTIVTKLADSFLKCLHRFCQPYLLPSSLCFLKTVTCMRLKDDKTVNEIQNI